MTFIICLGIALGVTRQSIIKIWIAERLEQQRGTAA
jgi:hypothetical protein